MKIYLKNDNPLSECYLRYSDLLEKSNKYDCVILNLDMTDEILASHKNILLIERLDGAAIWCRKLLKHPHVKTLLKMYHYPDLAINNVSCVGGRLFIPLDGSEKPQSPELTADDMAKIQPGFNFLHYSRFNSLFEMVKSTRIKPIHERSIFSFFAGTTVYDESKPAGRWITQHRKALLSGLEDMKANGFYIITAENRAFTNKKYIEIMLDTKIIYSPFGWGEFCYRDYEAILCGCVLKKPFLQKIIQVPDITHAVCSHVDLTSPPDTIALSNSLIEAKQSEKQIIERILE